ncbi:DUF2304 domain-containing protein [Clostridium hydrogeniformans]|uniref:DUF2304 domain-containing protein n=1 Tax=Clostridium hydrogeniformans TaxID=349933 RepID=UPI000558BDCC|nr:DUF2304 domain-containing protein [Clostridium hydrogeniformans]
MYMYCFIIAIAFLMLTIVFIKKRSLDIKFSFIWIAVGVIMAILSLNSSIVDKVAEVFDIKYPPSLLFLIGILFCFILIFNLIVVISSLQEKITRLTQEIGILKNLRERE